MFFCSLIEELRTKEENYKTSCIFNFGQECILKHRIYGILIHREDHIKFLIRKSNQISHQALFDKMDASESGIN